ncbi:peptidoglycan DD-metalloendopeptidase family protein [Candidatus Azambacteria bacterium]|nr:peptidoglycan DD-metalloendopeptidase family protein [Candidatus Azambacteria bacterium]
MIRVTNLLVKRRFFVIFFVIFPLIVLGVNRSLMTGNGETTENLAFTLNNQTSFAAKLEPIGGSDDEPEEDRGSYFGAWENDSLLPLVFYQDDSHGLTVYLVKEGDTLSSVAAHFNITINTLIWANNLKNKELKPGHQLVILPISGIAYTTKKNETVESIAKKFKTEASAITEFNQLASNYVVEGKELIIPNGIIEAPILVLKSKKSKSGSSYLRHYSITLTPNNDLLQKPLLVGRISQGMHGRYNGVDIASPCGTSVFPSAPGLIIRADDIGWNGGYGYNIIIQHADGSETLYGHLSKVIAQIGDYVSYNQVIGLVGSTGRSTGCHLHFEARGNRNPYLEN